MQPQKKQHCQYAFNRLIFHLKKIIGKYKKNCMNKEYNQEKITEKIYITFNINKTKILTIMINHYDLII